MNKKISTPIAMGIILILSVVLSIFALWQYNEIGEFPLIEFNKSNCTQDAASNHRGEGKNPCNRSCQSDDDCKQECGCDCISKEEKCIYTGIACEQSNPNYGCKCVNNSCSYEYIGKDETADWKIYANQEYGFEVKYPTNYYIGISGKREEYGLVYNLFRVDILNESQAPLISINVTGPDFRLGTRDWEEFQVGEIKGSISYTWKGSELEGCEIIFTSKDNQRFYIMTEGDPIKDEIFNQILSTFKFTD